MFTTWIRSRGASCSASAWRGRSGPSRRLAQPGPGSRGLGCAATGARAADRDDQRRGAGRRISLCIDVSPVLVHVRLPPRHALGQRIAGALKDHNRLPSGGNCRRLQNNGNVASSGRMRDLLCPGPAGHLQSPCSGRHLRRLDIDVQGRRPASTSTRGPGASPASRAGDGHQRGRARGCTVAGGARRRSVRRSARRGQFDYRPGRS